MKKVYSILIIMLCASILNAADMAVLESMQGKDGCDSYILYHFPKQKIGKAYETFAAFFVPKHKYAEYWKRFLPEEKLKYIVNKENVDNRYVMLAYNIIPKEKHVREHKRAEIEMVVDKERYFFKLGETDNGTNISQCYNAK